MLGISGQRTKAAVEVFKNDMATRHHSGSRYKLAQLVMFTSFLASTLRDDAVSASLIPGWESDITQSRAGCSRYPDIGFTVSLVLCGNTEARKLFLLPFGY